MQNTALSDLKLAATGKKGVSMWRELESETSEYWTSRGPILVTVSFVGVRIKPH